MSVSIDIVDQDIFIAVIAVLSTFLPANTPVLQGQSNRVPMPQASTGFVTLTSQEQNRLSTNVHSYPKTTNPTTKTIQQSTEYKLQMDFYGSQSHQWAIEAMTLFRDAYACDIMPANIQPLHADSAVQLPLVNGEQQYEQRWKVTLTLQYNPILTVPQDYANEIKVGIREVDTTFKP